MVKESTRRKWVKQGRQNASAENAFINPLRKRSQNIKYVWCSKYLQTEHFGASFIKLHQEMRKLLEFLAFVIVNIGAAFLNI